MRYWIDVDGSAVLLTHEGRCWWSAAPANFRIRDLETLRGAVARLRAKGYVRGY